MNKIIFDDITTDFSVYDFGTIKEEIVNKYNNLCLYNDEVVKPFEIVQRFLSIVRNEKSLSLFIDYIKTHKPVFMEIIGKNDYIFVGFEWDVDEISVIDFEC